MANELPPITTERYFMPQTNLEDKIIAGKPEDTPAKSGTPKDKQPTVNKNITDNSRGL